MVVSIVSNDKKRAVARKQGALMENAISQRAFHLEQRARFLLTYGS